MRNVIILLLLALMIPAVTLAQGYEDCLVFTESLLKNGDLVQENIPTIGDESDVLLDKFLALRDARQFLLSSLLDSIPCHEQPALDLLDATIGYQDYVTLRLGQKLVKGDWSIADTLDAADSSYDAYDDFWNPPDA